MTEAPTAIDWAAYVEGLVRQLLLLPVQRMHRRVLELAQPEYSSGILDLGCGTGNFTWALGHSRQTLFYVGLDGEPRLLERAVLEARRNLPHLYTHATFLEANLDQPADTWGLGRRIFDAAVCINNLYALTDPARTMAEVAQFVGRGGRLVVCNPGPNSDVMAVLEEHVWMAHPNDDEASTQLRAEERERILRILASTKATSEGLASTSVFHFLDEAGLRAVFGPEWKAVHHETIYGRPHQNHLLVLERV